MESKQFIEVINWDRAQPLMSGENNPWYKQYTSTLDNEQIIQLDDAAYRLLTNIWALAARLNIKDHGNVMRADTAFLKRHIPYLLEHNIEPNLEPLMNIKDMYGRAAPFIRYCEAPTARKAKDERRGTSDDGQCTTGEVQKDKLYDKVVAILGANEFISARALMSKFRISFDRAKNIVKSLQGGGLVGDFVKGKGFVVKARAQLEQNRVEKIDSPNGLSEEKKRINPNGFKESPQSKAQKQKQALLCSQSQNSGHEPANPLESDESDGSAVSTHILPKQPTSSFRGGQVQPVGNIIKGQFPLHWDSGECEEFGRDVLNALGIPADKSREFSKQEWGAFANWLSRLKSVCSAESIINELKEKMISKAAMLNKRKGKMNKSAVLTSIMEGELQSRGLNLPDVRASP